MWYKQCAVNNIVGETAVYIYAFVVSFAGANDPTLVRGA